MGFTVKGFKVKGFACTAEIAQAQLHRADTGARCLAGRLGGGGGGGGGVGASHEEVLRLQIAVRGAGGVHLWRGSLRSLSAHLGTLGRAAAAAAGSSAARCERNKHTLGAEGSNYDHCYVAKRAKRSEL